MRLKSEGVLCIQLCNRPACFSLRAGILILGVFFLWTVGNEVVARSGLKWKFNILPHSFGSAVGCMLCVRGAYAYTTVCTTAAPEWHPDVAPNTRCAPASSL